MANEMDAAARAQEVYDGINERTSQYSDFGPSELDQSRQYFDLSKPDLPTREFDVVTTLVGLPIPGALQRAFTHQLESILGLLPDTTRVYRVRPELLHWESHIIRRPGEPEPSQSYEEIIGLFADAVSTAPAFSLEYRGFFVSSDGTIAFQGYGPTAQLRSLLRDALPFSSSRQNETGHVSTARILDPVGGDTFKRLLDLRRNSERTLYGELPVDQVKLVEERRWYMEDYEVIATERLGT